MAIEYTLIKRFCKSLDAFFSADATLISLTGHSASDPRIYILSGDEELIRPCLVLKIFDTTLMTQDVDGVYETEVQAIAYSDSRLTSMDIAGAVISLCKQNTTTLRDASFNANNIRSMGIKALGISETTESLLEPTSIRRTERSDVVAPDRIVAIVPIIVRWSDTT